MSVLVAETAGGELILAKDAERGAVYRCPGCQRQLTAKAVGPGLWKRVPHFAHWKSKACGYQAGETEIHQLVKADLVRALRANPRYANDVDLEFRVSCQNGKSRRPDILIQNARPRGKRHVAIEVQCSEITPDLVSERTEDIKKSGAFVLWLPVFASEVVPAWWWRVLEENIMDNQGRWLAYRLDLGGPAIFTRSDADPSQANWSPHFNVEGAEIDQAFGYGWLYPPPITAQPVAP